MTTSLRMLMAVSLLILPFSHGSFEGRVVIESGQPLQGASVIKATAGRPDIEIGILVNTDETGAFRLNEMPDVLFVQKEGYLPTLYRIDGIKQNPLVVMKAITPDLIITLPECAAPAPDQRLVHLVSSYGMLLDGNVSFKQSSGRDSMTEIIYPGKQNQSMTIYPGLNGTVNYPEIDSLARTSSIFTRFIETSKAKDIRGITTDGKHWRWSFFGGGHFAYYGASSSAAEFFDHQIDSFCRIPQAALAK